MIIANLVGGLGNQMFQYACARSLAADLELPLKVSLDMFKAYASFHNGPELERAFSLELDIAHPDDLRRMIGMMRVLPTVRRALASKVLAPLRGKRFITEHHFSYWDGLLDQARTGGYLQGYWQSERYFVKHAASIRNDFTFRQPQTEYNSELARTIRDCVAVSIHVRRGDYVSDAKTLSVYGTCTPEYYFKAIEYLCQGIPDARLFVFSDDPKWVAEVLVPRYPGLVLVEHNRGDSSYNDMRLMSMCRHHIIANSSFSWWGAWLNSSKNKIVVAPRLWFLNGTNDCDLIPSSWIRV